MLLIALKRESPNIDPPEWRVLRMLLIALKLLNKPFNNPRNKRVLRMLLIALKPVKAGQQAQPLSAYCACY